MSVSTRLYTFDEIELVHLEVTDKCNASCPQCQRTDHGGKVNPKLSLTELTLKDIEGIFGGGGAKNLRQIILCGSHGDAIMARETLDICKFFRRENKDVLIGMHTNGSARNIDWWMEMARVLQPGYVYFGIDGLADTNHIYRRGTRFDLIMRNVQAFIDAGGQATWDFLLFEHNEHQAEEAEALAKEMGFVQFRLKETPRFFDRNEGELKGKTSVKDTDGNVLYYLSPPKTKRSQIPHVPIDVLRRKPGGYKGYLATTPITCIAAKKKYIYINADGYALPCSYLTSHIYQQPGSFFTDEFLAEIERAGGLDSLKAKLRPLKEIVNGPLFQEIVPASWVEGPRKNLTCARICGSEPRHVRG